MNVRLILPLLISLSIFSIVISSSESELLLVLLVCVVVFIEILIFALETSLFGRSGASGRVGVCGILEATVVAS